MTDNLYGWLRASGLQRYFPSFQAAGVTESNIADLSLSDYGSVGVNAVGDRKRLFQLVRVVRENMDSQNQIDVVAVEENLNALDLRGIKKAMPSSLEEPLRVERKVQPPPAQPAEPHYPVVKSPQEERRREPEPRRDTEPVRRQRSDPRSRMNPSRPLSQPKPKIREPVAEAPPPPIPTSSSSLKDRIRVVVRKRPMNRKELAKKEHDVLKTLNTQCLRVGVPKVKVDLSKYTENQDFVFDHVFGVKTTNQDIYETAVADLVNLIFEGGKATCFAYGQTGSGKTHTMMGNGDGIYALAANDIFSRIAEENLDLKVTVSFFEIYVGKLYDLLNGRHLLVPREDGNKNVVVMGLTSREVTDFDSLFSIIHAGNEVRSTAATGMHGDSSRSHAVLQISLVTPKGKFTFVDLAGSEYACLTAASDKQTRMEGSEINLSLLALKESIRSLSRQSKHTPFRQSKLTMVLRDSFLGNCRTVMIANVSPNSGSSENTLNTLRYADRVKELSPEKGQVRPPPGGGPPRRKAAKKPLAPVPNYDEEIEEASDRDRTPSPLPLQQGNLRGIRKLAAAPKSPMGPSKEDLESTHREVASDLFVAQDDLVTAHHDHFENLTSVLKKDLSLFDFIERPGADMDEYVRQLESLLDEKMNSIQALSRAVRHMRSMMNEEEALSRSIGTGAPLPDISALDPEKFLSPRKHR